MKSRGRTLEPRIRKKLCEWHENTNKKEILNISTVKISFSSPYFIVSHGKCGWERRRRIIRMGRRCREWKSEVRQTLQWEFSWIPNTSSHPFIFHSRPSSISLSLSLRLTFYIWTFSGAEERGNRTRNMIHNQNFLLSLSLFSGLQLIRTRNERSKEEEEKWTRELHFVMC